MAHFAYENASSDVLLMVQAYSKHLTKSGGSFSSTTNPTLTEVEAQLTASYYWAQAQLADNGYVRNPTGTAVLGVLTRLQAMDTVVNIELMHPITAETGEGENVRYKTFRGLRDEIVKTFLTTEALEDLGATRAELQSALLEFGGVSRDRKKTVRDDTDLVPSRFKRGFGADPRGAGDVEDLRADD